MIEKQIIFSLLDNYRKLRSWSHTYSNLDNYLEAEKFPWPDYEDLILDILNFPKDETIKNPEGFCRDYLIDILDDGFENNFSNEEIYQLLIKEKLTI